MDFMEIYWGYPNSWMVYFMENPNLKWMIFGKKWDNHGIIMWILGLSSGKLSHNYGKSTHFWWLNQLFLWPFSIVMLVYQRVGQKTRRIFWIYGDYFGWCFFEFWRWSGFLRTVPRLQSFLFLRWWTSGWNMGYDFQKTPSFSNSNFAVSLTNKWTCIQCILRIGVPYKSQC